MCKQFNTFRNYMGSGQLIPTFATLTSGINWPEPTIASCIKSFVQGGGDILECYGLRLNKASEY